MDFLDIIITVAILLAGGLMTGGKKKPAKHAAEKPAGMNTPTGDMPRGFLFDEDDDVEDVLFEDEDVETSAPKAENPYFSYEDLDADTNVASAHAQAAAYQSPAQEAAYQSPAQEAPLSDRLDVVDDETLSLPQFDLRQAVICQTILQNNYIPELK